MNGRHLFLAVIVASGAVLAAVFLLPQGEPSASQRPRSPSSASAASGSPLLDGSTASGTPAIPNAANSPSDSPRASAQTHGSPSSATAQPAINTDNSALPTPPVAAVEVEKARLMIRSYHTLTGENPVGTNAEIMQALMGHNPKQAMLGPPEGQSLNDKGELVDQWGTPFFFHQLSKDVMEIRSAGPDKTMGTADDAVVR